MLAPIKRALRMKRLFTPWALLLCLGLGTPAFSADFQKGVDARNKGDHATALREWEPLAERGNVDAQYNLGGMYSRGEGVPQDYKTAVKWYRLAAEQGDAPAQYLLGVSYNRGEGVPQDYKTAVKWYKLAAEQGDAPAQHNLGFMYGNGMGVTQDHKTAVKWYRLAAEQGLSRSQYNLGLKYARGQGTTQDYVLAHMWWDIVASKGNKAASKEYKEAIHYRHVVSTMMSPTQLETAQRLARECVKKNYKGC
jgi:uncharacterized protein